MAAKREIAEAVGDERIERVPTVGYLSRVQSEKGASIYVKVAELNPHLMFLIAGPNLGRYALRKLPENLVYVGCHPREKLLNRLLNVFTPAQSPIEVGKAQGPKYRSVLLSMNAHHERCQISLNDDRYYLHIPLKIGEIIIERI